MCKDLHESFLQLVRLGIGHTESTEITEKVDWVALKALAERQGLSAIVLDGLDAVNGEGLTVHGSMPQMMRLEWIGEVLQNYEGRYAAYEKAIGSLAEWYNQHGFKMMVLKGYACSLDWPKPEHRPCGDIDIWLFGQQREADATLSKEKGIRIDNSHHHHTVFNWQGFTIENHYDFVNVHHSRSNALLERVFKELGTDDSYSVELDETRVYVPSPNLHALFLLRHSMIEFAASGINLRQLLDWAFYSKKHKGEIDWSWLNETIEQYGMKKLYDVFNAIIVGDLGFDVNVFPKVQFDPTIKDKVLNEILFPAIPNEKPKNVISRMVWKWHRWKSSEWKHKLCYKESMWSAFCSGIWSHLLKPSSI